MSKQKEIFQINNLSDNDRINDKILQLQILKLQLKEEKLRDKAIYQSIKNKIAKN